VQLNFPKLDKKECIGSGKEIPMLDALLHAPGPTKQEELAPECRDFDYAPNRPGVGKLLEGQREKIAGKQRQYRERKEREEERRRSEEEEMAFGTTTAWELEDEEEEEAAAHPSTRMSVNFDKSSSLVKSNNGNKSRVEEEESFVSAQTSITIMKSEMSMEVPNTPKNGFQTGGL